MRRRVLLVRLALRSRRTAGAHSVVVVDDLDVMAIGVDGPLPVLGLAAPDDAVAAIGAAVPGERGRAARANR